MRAAGPCGLIVVLTLLACAPAARGDKDATAPETEIVRRIVHRFDFNEPDNPNTLPKYWTRFPGDDLSDPDFPRYTEALIDPDIGCAAPPSFYLGAAARSVAYRYVGPATRVTPGDYQVTGRVKLDRVRYARAALSAYYVDWQGKPVAGSQRFSRLAAPVSDDVWQTVNVRLPAAPSYALSVGVTCWLVQQDVWRGNIVPHRHVFHRDVDSGAWFDDIVLLGLPRVTLESTHAGNVVTLPRRVRLLATVEDEDITGLTSELTLRDSDGKLVYSSAIGVRTFAAEQTEEVLLPRLAPGLYTATLHAFSDGETIVERQLTFAVLRESSRRPGVVARRMGVMLTAESADRPTDHLALISALGVGMVKVPLWTGDLARPGFDTFPDALHTLLNNLITSRVEVVGVLAGPPVSLVQSAGAQASSLLEILNDDPRGWADALNTMVAPHASILRSWQLGADGDASDPSAAASALRALREQMEQMTILPNLTAAVTAADWPNGAMLPVENISVALPGDVRPEFVGKQLEPYRSLGYDRVWVAAPGPVLQGYRPDAVLGDWAREMIEARWSELDVVFVPQLWNTRAARHGPVTEPTLAYVAYRTIVDALAGTEASERFHLGLTAEVLAFADGDRSTLVLWDTAAPKEGTEYVLQLGSADAAFDLWGRDVPLGETQDGRHRIRLSRSPVFVSGTERWLMAIRAGLRLEPQRVDFSFEPTTFQLSIPNPNRRAISGEIQFEVPESWEVEPRRVRFSLGASETRVFDILIRHSHAESAGRKTLVANMDLLDDKRYHFEIPLDFELGLSDIDVWGHVFMDGDRLVIRHGLTSRAPVALSFRAFAVYPGRSRHYRVINELLPGQTLTVEYRFENAGDASGMLVRLGLEEVHGPRIHNLDVTVP